MDSGAGEEGDAAQGVPFAENAVEIFLDHLGLGERFGLCTGCAAGRALEDRESLTCEAVSGDAGRQQHLQPVVPDVVVHDRAAVQDFAAAIEGDGSDDLERDALPALRDSRILFAQSSVETEFARIQDQNRANTIYTSEEKVFKVRFDSIETFPPLFPFEEELLKSPLAHVITNFCRRIQVNPQSNWALSLYCASDAAEYNVKVSDEKPKLKLDIPFSQKLTQVLQDVIEEEGISASDGYSPDQVRERQVLLVNESEVYTIGTGENMTHSVDVSSFLPDPVVLEEILGISEY